MLKSSDDKQVLEALTWMGGHHRTEEEDWLGPDAETLESVRLVAAVRKSPVAQKSIAELASSENQWIREAAVLAQKQLPKKQGR
jgi:hypothetical protein